MSSIYDDIKSTFAHGNTVQRIILINGALFVVTALVLALGRGTSLAYWYQYALFLEADPEGLVYKPWTLLTHMFIHAGFWHVLFNLLLYHLFGNIISDLIGDHRILPIYVGGGLVGALFFLVYHTFYPEPGMYATGASAAVMATAVVAALIAPDYEVRLFLIGSVKIKYIVLVFILLNLIGSQYTATVGSNLAHLGGAAFGVFYVALMRRGIDLFSRRPSPPPQKQAKVVRMSVPAAFKASLKSQEVDEDTEEDIDRILDKIKSQGMDSLTRKEREALDKASRKS